MVQKIVAPTPALQAYSVEYSSKSVWLVRASPGWTRRKRHVMEVTILNSQDPLLVVQSTARSFTPILRTRDPNAPHHDARQCARGWRGIGGETSAQGEHK